MSIFKTIRSRVILILICLGLPPPGLTQAANEAPWDDSPAPFVLNGALIEVTADRRIGRGLHLKGAGGFQVARGRTLWVQGPLLGHPDDPLMPSPFWKLGDGHLELAGGGAMTGQIILARGSLGLAHDEALGVSFNSLDMAAGTRLTLRPGVHIGQNLHVRSAVAAQAPPLHWGLPPVAGQSHAAVWRVPSEEATLAGHIQAGVPIVKEGDGTLRLTGIGFSPDREPLTLAQGGLRVDRLWWGPVLTRPGTVLSGVGQVDEARVAGEVWPGGADRPGALLIGQRLVLLPAAWTRIRIDANGTADQIRSFGTVRLGGALRVAPVSGAWTPDRRWTIVQADGGLEYGADRGGDPAPGEGRYASVVSTLRYLDPTLDYGPTAVTLGLRYNARGLNTADAAWRSALLADSRFPRESALAHIAGGRVWAQSWAANTERSGARGLPGDDRDTGGLQIGISRPVGTQGAWAAFAGVQTSRLIADAQATGPAAGGRAYRLRSRSSHVGMGASLAQGNWRMTLGATQSWHRADLDRQADPAEPVLRSRPVARLSQAWLQIQPDRPMALSAWRLTPYVRAVWLRLRRFALHEEGGLAAVELEARTDRRWLGQLGVRIQRSWSTGHGEARMTLNLGMRRLWGGAALSSRQAYRGDRGRRFEVEGLPLPRHVLRLDLGMSAPVARRVRVELAYTGEHGGGQMQHGMWLGVRAGFR